MANLFDYLIWRGDLPVTADGFNDVDALAMANIAYNTLPAGDGGVALKEAVSAMPAGPQGDGGKYYKQWRILLDRAAETARYGCLTVRRQADVLDGEKNMQFAAVTIDLPDGRRVVNFRGTDHSIVGWREDFTLGFDTPVPAQTAAVEYLEREAARPGGGIIVTGHSKGGNLACYAAVRARPSARDLVEWVYNFDGPGLDEETVSLEAWRDMAPRIKSFVPQGSVVGLLLSYNPEYTIVHSTGIGIMQHDSFTWQIRGARFETAPSLDRGSVLMDRSLHQWLEGCSTEDRKTLVSTLFDVLEAGDAQQFKDVKKNLGAVADALRHMDAATLKTIGRMTGSLVQIGAGNLWDMLKRQTTLSSDQKEENPQTH